MRKLSRSARALLTIAGLLVLILLAALVIIPPLSSARIESTIREKLESRGVNVSELDGNLRGDGRVVIDVLCVNDQPPFQDEKLACVRGMTVNVALFAALRGSPQLESVSADSIELWMPRSRGTLSESADRLSSLLSKVDDGLEDEEGSGEDDGGALANLRGISIDEIVVNLDGHPAIAGAQRLKAVRGVRTDDHFDVTLEVIPNVKSDETTFGSSLSVSAPERFSVEIRARLDESRIESIQLTPDEPIAAQLSSGERTARGTLGGVAFEAPYSITMQEPALSIHGALSAEAASIMLEPGSWSTNLDEVFLANVVVHEPTVEVEDIEALKAFTRELRGGPEGTELAGSEEDAQSEDVDEEASTEVAGELSLRERIAKELDARDWWEVLPRRLETQNGTLRLASSGTRPAMELSQLNTIYGMRYIRFQMDVEASGQLYVGAQSAGAIKLDGFWNYQQSSLNAELGLERLDLGRLASAFTVREDVELGGTLGSEISVTGRLDEGFLVSAQGSLEAPSAELPLLSDTYGFDEITFEVPGRIERDEGAWTFAIEGAEFDFDGAEIGGGVTASELGADGLIASRLDFHLEVPDQPAMSLLEAVPTPVLGPLDDTQMTGNFGLTLKFPVLLSRDDDESLAIVIEDPTVYDFRDDDLALVELSEEVDVRRLNRSMAFVFRGPDDSIMRRIRIAAPSLMRDYPGISETDDTPLNWTRLWDVSFYVIAAQLYREDGSFFRNSGINWYQLRRVTAEAIEARKLGRGASTISMQLVKNLFLTHERSIERKLQELFLTYWMTRIVPKERILEVYLNIIEWGPNLNGIREASEFYFDKVPATLDVIEGTWLSSITPDPVDLGGDRRRPDLTAATCRRCKYLVEGLARRGWISPLEESIALETPSQPVAPAPAFDRPWANANTDPDHFGTNAPSPFGNTSLRAPAAEAEQVEAPSDFQLMSPRERLREWVNESRRLRGDGR